MSPIDDPKLWAELEHVLELSNGLIWDYFKETIGQAAFLLGVQDLSNAELYQKYEGLFVPPAGYDTLLKTTKYAEGYFQKRGLEFVKQLTETDKQKLKRLLEKNWGVGEAEFSRRIKGTYLFSPERAKRIYRTETHLAHEAGAHMFAAQNGARYKMWLGNQSNACPTCSRLHGEIVPVDQPFSLGTMYAHAHPRCRCTTLYFVKSPYEK